MTKKILQFIVLFFAVIVFIYAMFAFYYVEIHFKNWTDWGRFFFLFLQFVGGALSGCAVFIDMKK